MNKFLKLWGMPNNKYICKECGTRYSTPSNTPPPSPNWDDGHVCIMIKLDTHEQNRKSRSMDSGK
jgi:hypothetical protein